MDETSSISSENLVESESPAVEVTSKIMIMGVIILFMIVVISLFIHLYAKFCLSIGGEATAPNSNRHRRRRFIFSPGQEPPTNGALRKGLDPLVLRSLPILVFQSQEFKDGLECAVCLCDVVEGEKTRFLPKCNHGFHVDCIDMWFQSHSTCPLCRDPIGFESCKSCDNSGSNHEQNASDNESLEEEAENSPTFPINVLIWGNQTQVNSSIGTLLEESSSSNSTTSTSTSTSYSSSNRHDGRLVIDIPSETTSSFVSTSASGFAEDDLKSPISARLRSLKRLLSRDRRLYPMSSSYVDVEQDGETAR
ncbi:hypothetical protein TanjilG_21557 [Lupinus angustifolius]|uniref:RING-type E3 ubiquitin transferase n=1 Tax=Lupinus angustifolius TaxID=3871 RepID=A0A4P1QUG9_LUPAN|nr:PREDICTED: RING-H2 finger protein ATL60-like [Lupinus angustifolius]OIV95167.1 hypothetical protein TanjilG_21557 [Lupinus angustifolius]